MKMFTATLDTISLAVEQENQVETITLPSPRHKSKALKTDDTEWIFDDTFNGITTLHSPDDPDLDICAVHGLNGNAFESWVATKNRKMWLRDILPYSKPFDKARIMTFGYSSRLRDKGNLSGITVWSQDLLRIVSSVRVNEQERERPIIFVIQWEELLLASQSEYRGISLLNCGLLFLSTPHSGSLEADWNDFLTGIAQLTLGVRKEIVKTLGSFNPMSTEGQREFMNMKMIPPFDAFHETRKISIALLNRHIVTKQSASLSTCIAQGMPDIDHHTTCKFESKFGGFEQVSSGEQAKTSEKPDNLKFDGKDNFSLVIAGMGGIGKTAAALKIGRRNKDRRNVFFVNATDEQSLNKAYLDIARQLGHEYLLKNYRGQDLIAIWSNQTPEEKIDRFQHWLDDKENENALFILDDIDGIKDLAPNSNFLLHHQARNILLTSRNPNLHPRDGKTIKLGILETADIVTILEAVRSLEDADAKDFPDLYNPDTLLSIAKAVHGHPLAASIAMNYIIRRQSLNDCASAGQDFPTNAFYHGNISGIQRTFVSPKKSRLVIVDFKKFFALSEIANRDKLPDVDILGLRKESKMPLLHQIEEVSLMERIKHSRAL
ncbi:hypothetical protein NHQ30_003243 [Ciborinia camelliae]|nr:hypothetical protein NHQ30_003243 [Ciborinia camelliae]